MFRLPDSWLWDFWLAKHDKTYHLFFLYASRALHDPDRRHLRAGVGHAVSTDLVNWTRVADAIVRGDAPGFDRTATWTGSVVRGPDGTWSMFYTGTTRHEDGTLQQQVGRATSPDLYHWVKDERNPLVCADPRWYETLGGADPWRDEHWRDPWVFADPDGDGWHMLITARAGDGAPDDRGVIGRAHSPDLVEWEVRPPLSEPGGGFGQLEVPQVEKIDGRWVLIFNCAEREFSADRAARGGPGGIWVANAGSALGPYDIAGATLLSDDRFYVGKLVRDPDDRWVLLAFVNKDDNGDFVGELTDPMPVGWAGDRLVRQPGT
jgi:sucrose-6-phosphate hydrolase SacC (GH32 family)